MQETNTKPTSLIVIGMAGSGKTTLIRRLLSYCSQHKLKKYLINLDPACLHTLKSNIDIRDTISYKDVMKEYGLGPNGSILTCLNLFTTKFDQVLGLLETKKDIKYVVVDTPGQIELFTWSSSGLLITQLLSTISNTVILYVIDSEKCRNTKTFMSNMLYAVSILYKMQRKFLIVFNKIDLFPIDTLKEWMSDFEKFNEHVDVEEMDGDGGYMTSLLKSMSIVLEEFYHQVPCIGVSAVTGEGARELFEAIDQEVKQDIVEEQEKEAERVEGEMQKLVGDLSLQ